MSIVIPLERRMMNDCPLCGSKSACFADYRSVSYLRCDGCKSVWMDPKYHLKPNDEKARYEKHNNDPGDPRYQAFVRPVITEAERWCGVGSEGLDFGAGPGPVISMLLSDKGYRMRTYDPFFWPDHHLCEISYDFVVCCEVIEHFHFPRRAFEMLRRCLRPGGVLVMMTELYRDKTDFPTWYYKNDETHVFFYHPHAFSWIQNYFGFSFCEIDGRVIVLQV